MKNCLPFVVKTQNSILELLYTQRNYTVVNGLCIYRVAFYIA